VNIVVLDGFTLNPGDLSWDELKRLGSVTIYDRTPAELILERSRDADMLLTNKTPLRADTLAQLPKLKYIGVLATGYDVVDIRAAAERNIVVSNVPEYGTDSVAQHVFALVLELAHRTGSHSESVHRGEWAASPDFCYWRYPLVELAGKTMGIVGAGRIGLRTARIAAAFGMRVIAYSRSGPKNSDIPELRWGSLDELLRESDVVSLHCPLTPETEGMINKQALSLMKKTAFLINTARGKLINEQDLAEALESGAIAGAGLDVLSSEPPRPDHPLYNAKNCIITPHIAWATIEARRRLMAVTTDNVRAFLAGSPQNVVNR